MSFGSPGPFPIPGLSTIHGIGPPWLKMHEFQPDYNKVMDRHEYEDGGASFVIYNVQAPVLWLIEYDGLDGIFGGPLDYHVLDSHRADAFGQAYGFNFTNPRTGYLYTDVHYDESFEEDHEKVWTNKRSIHLIKRPA